METNDGLQRSLEKYIGVAHIIDKSMNSFFGEKTPLELFNLWQLILINMRLIDNQIDCTRDYQERMAFQENLKNFISNKSDNLGVEDLDLIVVAVAMRRDLNTLPESNRKAFSRNVSLIFRVTEQIRHEQDITKLRKLILLEGQLTSNLFLNVLPDTYIKAKQFPQFSKWFKRLGRVGNSFDTLIDLEDDHIAGEVMVKSSPLVKLSMMGDLVGTGLKMIKDTPISLFKDLALATFATTHNYSRKK